MKHKLKRIMLPLIVIILIFGLVVGMGQNAERRHERNRFAHTTPTLFFHGFGSSSHAEEQMVNSLKSKGITNTVIKANVNSGGQVSLSGKLPHKIKNPVVEVNFENSRETNYRIDGKWTKNVVKVLQKRYGMKTMNMVGHSMGNMDIMYYLLANANDSSLPKLKKQVDIAGHFNGILGYSKHPDSPVNQAGKPAAMDQYYRELLPLRKNYPNKQVKVLNIYGNVGNGSDGRVSNNSSKSLKYLLNGRELSYEEREIKGVSHSKLHDNRQVDDLLAKFIYE